MSVKIKGYILGIVAAATYGMNPLFALPLYQGGMSPESVLLFRYVLALPAIFILLKIRGRNVSVSPRRILPLCLLGVLMALSSLLLFVSYKHLDVGIASTLLFIYPLIVAVIMTTLFHEILSVQSMTCIVAALFGVWLLCAAPGNGQVTPLGISLVVMSSLCYAVYLIWINRPPVRGVATLTVTFWVLLSGALMFCIIICFKGHLDIPSTPWLWINVVMLALVPTVVSFLCTNAAIEKIGSTPTAILGVFEPATAVIFGVTVFGELLSLRQIFGLIVIFVSVTLVVAGGNLSRHVLSIRRMFPSMRHRHGRRE
ncbi:MAG: DMT family transporter [Bacteroidales bacterium]|nr:DMT family transporter [Bacteroidales bacterium]